MCLNYECRRKQIRKPNYFNQWIDVRATYKVHFAIFEFMYIYNVRDRLSPILGLHPVGRGVGSFPSPPKEERRKKKGKGERGSGGVCYYFRTAVQVISNNNLNYLRALDEITYNTSVTSKGYRIVFDMQFINDCDRHNSHIF